MGIDTRIERLEQQRLLIEQQLRQANAKKKRQERQDDDRRRWLVGGIALSLAETDEQFGRILYDHLRTTITATRDRTLLGLEMPRESVQTVEQDNRQDGGVSDTWARHATPEP